MENFEAFSWNISLSGNLLFLKRIYCCYGGCERAAKSRPAGPVPNCLSENWGVLCVLKVELTIKVNPKRLKASPCNNNLEF